MPKSLIERIEERKIECKKRHVPSMAESIGKKGELFEDYSRYWKYTLFTDNYFRIRNDLHYNDELYEEGWEHVKTFVWYKGCKYAVFIGSYDEIESFRPGIWIARLDQLYHKLFPPKPVIQIPILNEREMQKIKSSPENELKIKWGIK